MLLTALQSRLAETIDTHVRQVLAQGGDDEALLLSLADSMPTFKQLLDTCTGAEMDMLCDRYDGFYRFVTLLERLAEESREMLGIMDQLRYNGLIIHLPLEPGEAPICVSNFSSSCAAMRVRKRPSRM